MGSELTPERRMVVALLLSFAIYLGWGYYALDKRKHAPSPLPAAETTSPVLPSSAAPGAAPVALPSSAGTNPPPVATPEQIIDIDSPELHLSLSSWGGALVHAAEVPEARGGQGRGRRPGAGH